MTVPYRDGAIPMWQLVVVRPEPSGQYTAQVVGIPEVRATAATEEEAIEQTRQTLAEWLKTARWVQVPVPPDTADHSLPRRPKMLAWWTRQQIAPLVTGVLLAPFLLSVMLYIQPEYVRPLWTDPLGIKMSIITILVMTLGATLYLVRCRVLNYRFSHASLDRPCPHGRPPSPEEDHDLLLLFGLITLPSIFLVICGPAFMKISQTILR
jgi:hypothetical protein